jgi:hypothetical protein
VLLGEIVEAELRGETRVLPARPMVVGMELGCVFLLEALLSILGRHRLAAAMAGVALCAAGLGYLAYGSLWGSTVFAVALAGVALDQLPPTRTLFRGLRASKT